MGKDIGSAVVAEPMRYKLCGELVETQRRVLKSTVKKAEMFWIPGDMSDD